jgi:hypothetical protein
MADAEREGNQEVEKQLKKEGWYGIKAFSFR